MDGSRQQTCIYTTTFWAAIRISAGAAMYAAGEILGDMPPSVAEWENHILAVAVAWLMPLSTCLLI